MRETMDLGGTTPPMEICAQVGSQDYDYLERARKEARAYIHQFRRVFGPEPDGARLTVKSHPHDFGTYLTVVCHFDTDLKESADYAQKCEAECPPEWDEEARQELHLPERS